MSCHAGGPTSVPLLASIRVFARTLPAGVKDLGSEYFVLLSPSSPYGDFAVVFPETGLYSTQIALEETNKTYTYAMRRQWTR